MRKPESLYTQAAQQLNDDFVKNDRYPGVIAVGIGRRLKADKRRRERTITLFVHRKYTQDELLKMGYQIAPQYLELKKNKVLYKIPVDIVEIGQAEGLCENAQSTGNTSRLKKLFLCEALYKKSNLTRTHGVISWLIDNPGTDYALVPSHIMGRLKKLYTEDGKVCGTLLKDLYKTHQSDAALLKLSPGFKIKSELLLNRQPVLSPVLVKSTDTSEKRKGWVYVPHEARYRRVQIYYIHIRGLGFGNNFKPFPLILTEQVTKPGDSGTLLFNADLRPVGLLTGSHGLKADGRYQYSCFMELVPSLQYARKWIS